MLVRFIRRLRQDLRGKQVEEAEQILRLTKAAKEAERQPRPIGWTAWPPVSGGASRTGATVRPPSASRWK
jgi:hypothetical protein